MKLLLIHNNDGKIGQIQSLFGNMDIQIDTVPVNSPETDCRQIIDQLSSVVDFSGHEGREQTGEITASYGIIVSSINRRWLDFFAGVSCGRGKPFLVYGEEAIASIPGEFSSCFKSIRDEKSLVDYLLTESKAIEKMEEAVGIRKAREALLRMGIPISAEALADCAARGNILEISFFLAAGFSPDTRNKAGVPLLNIAARSGNSEVLRFLILTEAEINLRSEDRGTSALLDSVTARYYDMAADLIRAGADLNVKNNSGQTALLVATGNSDERMVEILLKAGADPDISDSMGVTARTYAALFHNSRIIALFETYTAEKTQQ